MRKKHQRNKYTAVWLLAALLFLLSCVAAFFLPTPEEEHPAILRRATGYTFSIDGKAAFYADDFDNWTTARFSTNGLDMPMQQNTVVGTWPRHPRQPLLRRLLRIGIPDPAAWEKANNDSLAQRLRLRLPVLEARTAMLERRIEELKYYLRTHGVVDEGYNTVADYETKAHADLQAIKNIKDMILKLDGKRLSVSRQQQYERLGHPDSLASAIDTLNAIVMFGGDHYEGELNARLQPDGHGILTARNGKVYDGMWTNGRRNGFGISLDSDGRVRIGEWKDDVYKGERPTYSADHVYGIDISRHQHEKKGKKLPVSWADVRITHLGKRTAKRISGDVDFPVSFCFIKATEGTSISNAYYNSDYTQARRHGIRVGTYHFLSMKSPAADQAAHFLKTAHLRAGDLPPMLDVEPTDAVINQYGGPEKLMKYIRTWLTIVEQRTGVRPIVYSYQKFFDKYLSDADDIKRNYRVWIARYGEYKPDLQLLFWQLGSDARVKGFVGDVDVNIFNGYHDQWEEFLASDSIR